MGASCIRGIETTCLQHARPPACSVGRQPSHSVLRLWSDCWFLTGVSHSGNANSERTRRKGPKKSGARRLLTTRTAGAEGKPLAVPPHASAQPRPLALGASSDASFLPSICSDQTGHRVLWEFSFVPSHLPSLFILDAPHRWVPARPLCTRPCEPGSRTRPEPRRGGGRDLFPVS